jgi:short-subunit dehydrogenase
MPSKFSWSGKRYWLIGASTGLGAELAKDLSEQGAEIILSARNEAQLSEVAQTLSGPSHIVPCDVGDTSSVTQAFDKVKALGKLDGLIFCAGLYKPMAAQKWDAAMAETICDVNFTGGARVLGAAMPTLLENDHAHIVLIGSLAGFKGIPGATAYGASKAGLIHMAENLRADLDPKKVKVQIINPGFIKTRLTDKNSFKMPFIMDVEEASLRTRKAMESKRFSTSYPTRFVLFFKLIGMLPNWLYFPFVQGVMTQKSLH